MGYIYGPVPSRRLGRSLGIDPVPIKTCNWNCVYCQLGRTRRLIRERPPGEPWVSPADQEGKLRALAILGDVARVLPPTPQEYDFGSDRYEEAVIEVIQRHPLPDKELRRHLPEGREEEIIAALEKGSRVQRVNRYGRWFWTSIKSSYGGNGHDQ